MGNKVLIVDGDILNFTVCRVTEDISQFGDEVYESFDEEATIRGIEAGLDSISDKTGYNRDDIIYALSSDSNFRKRHFPTYKSNRKNVKKPVGLKWLREYLVENREKYNILMMEELEADDAIGIAATSDPNVAIYSQDKDLRTIPVKQWNFKLDKFIIPEYIDSIRWLYTQVLTGDAVDGYSGCPRIGKVKAGNALANCYTELELLEMTYNLYWNHYGETAKEELLRQIGQARILHLHDYLELVEFDTTYDPFKIFNVTQDTLDEWTEKYKELRAKKKKVKNGKTKKDEVSQV